MSHTRAILLVDDNPDDRFLIRRAFTKAGVVNPLHEVKSGEEAIAYLSGADDFSDRVKYPFPGILLVDLNMPGIDGFGVLEWVRRELNVQGMLIIVLSRLDEVRNLNKAYALGANSFLSKPGNDVDLDELIHSFRDYWLLRNKAPEIQKRDKL